MTKKLLIISLTLFGLVAGIINVSAQEAGQSQPITPAPDTPAPLISVMPDVNSAIPEADLRPGIRSPHVKKVQEALKTMGYLPSDLETTEYLGPKTREAIRRFQEDKNLPATGFFGPMTRTALKRILQEGRPQEGQAVIDRNVDIACMKTAVEKRENALLSAHDVYTGKIRAARETRKTELLAAWSIQDPRERHKVIKAAWEKYHQNVKTARTEWNQSRRTIWIEFAKDAKNCKASAVETQDLENVEVTPGASLMSTE